MQFFAVPPLAAQFDLPPIHSGIFTRHPMQCTAILLETNSYLAMSQSSQRNDEISSHIIKWSAAPFGHRVLMATNNKKNHIFFSLFLYSRNLCSIHSQVKHTHIHTRALVHHPTIRRFFLYIYFFLVVVFVVVAVVFHFTASSSSSFFVFKFRVLEHK